jgi:hypothetical protein
LIPTVVALIRLPALESALAAADEIRECHKRAILYMGAAKTTITRKGLQLPGQQWLRHLVQ